MSIDRSETVQPRPAARVELGGTVGGRIVAEVFIGLLQGDGMSYLHKEPTWKPTLGQDLNFTMADLLRFAGVA